MGSLIDGVLNKLDEETIIFVLNLLETPSDLARAACVCCSWRKYVIEGELWKRMCLKSFPEVGIKCFRDLEEQSFSYCLLLRRLLSPPLERTCIAEPLHASSTDDFLRECVAQTLYPEPKYEENVYSYWSSEGEASSIVPEILTYRLASDLCVVHDVKVQPFLASFRHGNPIYSSQMVRFRFGYARFPKPHWSGLFTCLSERPVKKAITDDYVWTYESPAFSMAQENTLQTFRLPKPVLCVGGILQVELLGRVQVDAYDGLYYICISHVYVTGRPIVDFQLESMDPVILRRLIEKEKRILLEQSLCSIAFPLEHLRLNRSSLENGSVVDMLLLYLLDSRLLDGLEDEMDESTAPC